MGAASCALLWKGNQGAWDRNKITGRKEPLNEERELYPLRQRFRKVGERLPQSLVALGEAPAGPGCSGCR